MKGGLIIEKILELIEDEAKGVYEIMDAMLTDYSTSRRKLGRIRRGLPTSLKSSRNDEDANRKLRSLLYYLKRQGFIQNKSSGKTANWLTTALGIKKLEALKHRNKYSKNSARYGNPKSDQTPKLIIYDIPTNEPVAKRHWLRWSLANLGFKNLQKSVWIGKYTIPEEFLADLHDRRLLDYVHIFEIAKRGTLTEIT